MKKRLLITCVLFVLGTIGIGTSISPSNSNPESEQKVIVKEEKKKEAKEEDKSDDIKEEKKVESEKKQDSDTDAKDEKNIQSVEPDNPSAGKAPESTPQVQNDPPVVVPNVEPQPSIPSQVTPPAQQKEPVVEPQPEVIIPACDSSIPAGAYLDYNAACDAGENFLNNHWGEGYHYSVSILSNGCGTTYYILDIYQI